jgi:hypothetical protein
MVISHIQAYKTSSEYDKGGIKQNTNYNANIIDIPTLGKFQQVHMLH